MMVHNITGAPIYLHMKYGNDIEVQEVPDGNSIYIFLIGYF